MRNRNRSSSRGYLLIAMAALGIGGSLAAPGRADAQLLARFRQAVPQPQPQPNTVVVPPPPDSAPAPRPAAPNGQPPAADPNANPQPNTNPAPNANPNAAPESKPATTDPERPAAPKPQPPRNRNGLLFRYQMPCPPLPPDPDRDTFYGTRYDDRDAPLQYHYWNPKRGGLYGQLLPGQCTACNAPFFRGQPGGVIGPGCEASHPAHRLIHGATHHLKPVGYYYSGGCWVPKYDLDPWVIGPDNFPYPFKRDHHKGG